MSQSNVRDGNIAARLSLVARVMPSAISIAQPSGPVAADGTRDYDLTTFDQLDRYSDELARGMVRYGARPGARIVMLVPFGAKFIEWVFALLKTGVAVVLIDPGIDKKHLIACLEACEVDGFVGIPKAQAIRTILRRRFPNAHLNVTLGRRWFWGGKTESQIREMGRDESTPLPTRERTDPAAIIFTTGSTGPPKGVQYTHGTFHAQVDRIKDRYDIHRGSRDLACFPLFGLFDAVMGVTTIIPDMDPTRPADVNPRRLIEAVEQWEIDQAFGSPALWRTVTRWAEQNVKAGRPFPTLRCVLSAGAPVPVSTLRGLRELVHPDANIHTPYGATEALPIASIESRQVITHTGPAAEKGKGVCVGHRFEGVRWKVIEISDDPIESIDQIQELAPGKIGELIVSGPMVTRQYVVRTDQNAFHKIADGDDVWHRMGDVGYLDADDRFWFCGRKAHRIVGEKRTWFTIPCEAVFNRHPQVERCALVAKGERPNQSPVLIVEPVDGPRGSAATSADQERLREQLIDLAIRNPLTRQITDIRIWPEKLPVDIRHNSKIFRERLAKVIAKK
ncbi:MAG: fatty acid CoA ligase family protein [Planctomycetota bacterium]